MLCYYHQVEKKCILIFKSYYQFLSGLFQFQHIDAPGKLFQLSILQKMYLIFSSDKIPCEISLTNFRK